MAAHIAVAMTEDLSPEAWTTERATGADRWRRTSRRPEDERAAAPPRAAEVLQEIAFMLLAHALVVLLVLSIVKAFGIC
jgi:hypothetical protein